MSLTHQLSSGVIELAGSPLDGSAMEATRRTLLNVLGTAIGASQHPDIVSVVRTGVDEGGVGVASVPGRIERLDRHWAAIATGMAAHLDDFDDTHLETVIHPGAASLAATFPVAMSLRSSGAEFLRAFMLGCEVQLRLGRAMTPWHYDEGWHITGTCGVMGAAVAAGLLLGLDEDALTAALGIAASQTLGVREAFGTSIKSFHPGKAGANGILAAALADKGFTSSPDVLNAPRGYFNVLSLGHKSERVLEGLGEEWELLANTFKPYPCGIVSHPAIDASIAMHDRVDSPAEITEVVVRCHPLVPELTGNPEPTTGLEARFSTIHGVAAGLLDGAVGLAQYETSRVVSSDAVTLRSKIALEAAPEMARDAVSLELRTSDGATLRKEIDHARGSLDRPLTEDELQQKVAGLVEPVLGDVTGSLIEAVDSLEEASNLDRLDEVVTQSGLRRQDA